MKLKTINKAKKKTVLLTKQLMKQTPSKTDEGKKGENTNDQ